MKLMHNISQGCGQPWERVGIVGRSGAALSLANYALFRPIRKILLKKKIKSVVTGSITSTCHFAFRKGF